MFDLTERQKQIVEIVKGKEAISGDEISEIIGVTRSALRTDFNILTKLKIINSKPKLGYTYNSTVAELKVSEKMSPPHMVDAESSVYETILYIFANNVGTVYVIKDGYLVGLVSRKDLIKTAIGNKDLDKVPINVIMTRMPNIIYIKEDDTVKVGVEKLIKHEIDSLPVVKECGEGNFELVGRFTKTNITKLFLERMI